MSVLQPLPSQSHIIVQGVLEPGSPNFERIVFWITGPMNLAGFGITLAYQTEDKPYPLFDHCFWFPDIDIDKPSWVVVYSRKGTTEWNTFGEHPVLNLFWQRNATVFRKEAPKFVPMLFNVEGVATGPIVPALGEGGST